MPEHTRIHNFLVVSAVVLAVGVVIEGYFLLTGEKEERPLSRVERPARVSPPAAPRPGGAGAPQAAADPYQEMLIMQKKIDRMFEEMMSRRDGQGGVPFDRTLFEPAVDVKETEDEYVIICDLPGMEEDKISVYFEGDHLVIKGARETEEAAAAGKGMRRKERRFGSFRRVVPLPPHTDKSGVKAEYTNGVLTIIVPKTGPAVPGGPHDGPASAAGEGRIL
jgi:HSP20 family protein